ncbi:hypothetical protein OXX80_013851 [Metschnikowia pulcherrima]
MKIVNLAVLAFASCILAKNIIYLDDLVSAMNKDKREAKNIVSLDALKDEAANAVYDASSEKNAAAPGQKKRHPARVAAHSAVASKFTSTGA